MVKNKAKRSAAQGRGILERKSFMSNKMTLGWDSGWVRVVEP